MPSIESTVQGAPSVWMPGLGGSLSVHDASGFLSERSATLGEAQLAGRVGDVFHEGAIGMARLDGGGCERHTSAARIAPCIVRNRTSVDLHVPLLGVLAVLAAMLLAGCGSGVRSASTSETAGTEPTESIASTTESKDEAPASAEATSEATDAAKNRWVRVAMLSGRNGPAGDALPMDRSEPFTLVSGANLKLTWETSRSQGQQLSIYVTEPGKAGWSRYWEGPKVSQRYGGEKYISRYPGVWELAVEHANCDWTVSLWEERATD